MTQDLPMDSTVYDRQFFQTLNDAGPSSAAAVLPHVVALLSPRSAVDVGCGTGVWAAELARLGVVDVVGVDGAYVPRDQRLLPHASFVERDLTSPLGLGRRFDVALCLEVGEHLAPAFADHLVEELVGSAPAVVFSAAPPLQGGVDHVNEQWPDYWITKFSQHGYTAWDLLRPHLRYDSQVAWIYRQNLMVMLEADHDVLTSVRPELQLKPPPRGDVPFEYVARYLLEREDGLAATLARLPRLVLRRMGPGR